MKYILILMLFGSGKAVNHVEFDTHAACDVAVSQIQFEAKKQHWDGGLSNYVFLVCVPKGTEGPS